jgi:hypothetical protein
MSEIWVSNIYLKPGHAAEDTDLILTAKSSTDPITAKIIRGADKSVIPGRPDKNNRMKLLRRRWGSF